MKWNSQILPFTIGSILILLSFYFFSSIWLYIILSAIISLIARPFTKILSKIKIGKFSLPNGIRSGLSLFLFWALFFIFLKTFIPLIAQEATELSNINVTAIEEQFHDPISKVQNLSKEFLLQNKDFNIQDFIQERIQSVLSLKDIKNLFGNTVGAIGNIFIAIFAISFISFFLIKDNKLLMKGILSFAPVGKEQKVEFVVHKIVKLLSRYFSGLIIEVLAIIFLVTIGLWIVGIGFSHAIVIGLVAGFLNVIPYVGPLIGMAFGSIIAISTELTNQIPDNLLFLFIGIIAVFLIAQLIDNFILQPLIYSNSVNASPLEIFLVILMAGTLGGISGMILAIPIYTIIRVIAKETLSQFKIVDSLTKNL